MSWIDDPWMGFDTETTGVRALKDRLVTAALVLRIDGASYRSGVSSPDQVATWLTDPGVEIPEQATAVHGITTEQARATDAPSRRSSTSLAGSIVEHLAARLSCRRPSMRPTTSRWSIRSCAATTWGPSRSA